MSGIKCWVSFDQRNAFSRQVSSSKPLSLTSMVISKQETLYVWKNNAGLTFNQTLSGQVFAVKPLSLNLLVFSKEETTYVCKNNTGYVLMNNLQPPTTTIKVIIAVVISLLTFEI